VPIRAWISERHSLRVETATVLGLYAVYETVRGLVAGDATAAVDRAHAIARLEQQMHLFAEPTLQAAAHRVPGLLAVLGAAYVTLHLTVSAAVLLWLHRRRAAVFPVVRTTLLIASGLSLVLFVLVPTAPPRLAGIGVRDTVSGGTVDLNHGLVSSLYNPYAAVPSMHIGYALVVGATIFVSAHRRWRVAGVLYPVFVLFVIVATGNHFFFDAVAGALVAAVSFAAATFLTREQALGGPSLRSPARATSRSSAQPAG
jgi:hypothetical protein